MDKFKDIGTSRFFKNSDINSDNFIYAISPYWWSRLYEYPWAGSFAESNDICLDAACGVGHHLKFYLAQHCSKVYCCDLDSTLNNPQSVFSSVKNGWGDDAYNSVLSNSHKMDFKCCSITSMPYDNNFFDKIYCISVLEHLSQNDMFNSLIEFKRVLKDDGFLVLTFDYPSVNLEYLNQLILDSGFKFAYDVNFDIPLDCLESAIYPGLKCFRALLIKA